MDYYLRITQSPFMDQCGSLLITVYGLQKLLFTNCYGSLSTDYEIYYIRVTIDDYGPEQELTKRKRPEDETCSASRH